jgi:hypothetical protein
MTFGDEDEAGQTSPGAIPAKENPTSARRRPLRPAPPASVFHRPAYRKVLADWPVEWREQWGHRANALEDNGLSWRDAETQAFLEVWSRFRNQHASASLEAAPADVAAGADKN